MADDRNDLLPNEETAVYGSLVQPQRRSYSCGATVTAFSILAAVLLAGQAVTTYFVYQHNSQISKLTKKTQELRMESLTNKLAQDSGSNGKMKMTMANAMPMLMRELPSNPEETETSLTNSTEDQVKRLLLLENPTRKFPELKGSFMENMNQLRRQLGYEDWKAFEIWMHKWLLFQMAQDEAPEEKGKVDNSDFEHVTHSGVELTSVNL
ncbi:HLA class II histocompatibility antigen gamma chain isoform X2 [Hemicordylus capensis]|uniref:HLA class II histocompatibility antigen gamma chain isoform X2 n=1 Tax=Hemicordylus capensis TaxID=884348 RepID=UPI0023021696|nr:HLA class II histocompatibility antigen gamma chain isoform X2 [Hemicordylus capensis]